ncbi:MAG: ribosome-recycling factor [Mycoplasmataceae bacterium]|nr:ribosome-recycling factor [Mycoplasmataceae bacterium]
MEWKQLNSEFQLYINEAANYLNDEYFKIRSGRISPSVFDDIKVEVYGDFLLLNQVANIQIVDATTVFIKPYDKSSLKDIATAISKSSLNVNPVIDVEFIKIKFPPITEETRLLNVKRCKEYLEQAKSKIRKGREEIKLIIKKNTSSLSEDDVFYFNGELDKETKNANSLLENIFNKKQQELLKI